MTGGAPGQGDGLVESWLVELDVPEEDAEERGAALFELGATGVEQRDATTLVRGAAGKVTLVASFASREDASAAHAELEPSAPRLVRLEGDAWRDEYKKYFHPFRVCEGVVIRPPWEECADLGPGEKVLVLEPGRAFGTGLHESTSLVCEALRGLPRGPVLDVGCGSGILGLVALALGAPSARAVDVDADAVQVARENAARNAAGDRLVADTTALEALSGEWPVVVANIEAAVLIPMAQALSARVASGGHLVLSGVLRAQETDVRAAYSRLEHVETRAKGEWVAVVFRKP